MGKKTFSQKYIKKIKFFLNSAETLKSSKNSKIWSCYHLLQQCVAQQSIIRIFVISVVFIDFIF